MAFVTLIRPQSMFAVSAPSSIICPPLGLAYIASSLLKAGHKVDVVDALGEAPAQSLASDDPEFQLRGLSIEQILKRVDLATEIVGISCMFSYEWPHIRRFIESLRVHLPKALIVLGGEHPSAMAEFCLEDCIALDVCVVGEGEETIVDLASNWSTNLTLVNGIVCRKEGKIFRSAKRMRIRKIDEIPQPAWHMFPIDNYLDNGLGRGVNRGRNMPIMATRGCPHRCTFCSNEDMWTPQWIPRKPDLVVAEIEEYINKYRANNFDFYDLTMIVRKDWAIEFCQLIIAKGLKFSWQLASGTRSEAITNEVSVLLQKAGCTNISYAPESGSLPVLQRIKKRVDLTKLVQSMHDSEKNGIYCKANILFGFPGETHREVWTTLKFIVRAALSGIHDLSIYPFSPYPGSALFDQLKESGRIPKIDDSYFYALARSTAMGLPPSFSNFISDKALGRYRLFGIFLFYGTSFLRRPQRVFTMIKNIFGTTQETLLESVLHDRFVRRFKQRWAISGATDSGPSAA